MEGRVEIRYHGTWGTICDDDFSDMAAKVICNSLGFHGSAIAKKDGAFGPGNFYSILFVLISLCTLGFR